MEPTRAELIDLADISDRVFEKLNLVFRFTIDARANSIHESKNRRFWTPEENGLRKDWSGERVFVFPPWSGRSYNEWLAKALYEYAVNGAQSVLFIPFRGHTEAFGIVWDHCNYLIIPQRRTRLYIPRELYDLGVENPQVYGCFACFWDERFGVNELKRLSAIGRVINLDTGLFRI